MHTTIHDSDANTLGVHTEKGAYDAFVNVSFEIDNTAMVARLDVEMTEDLIAALQFHLSRLKGA